MSRMYGYVRVSMKDQCGERQLIALREFGIRERDIFMDKLSGKDFERPCYRRLMRRLRPGDVVLDMPLLDTRPKAEENIRQRQAEGIAAARARGVRFGREKKPVPDGIEDLWGRMAESGLPKD